MAFSEILFSAQPPVGFLTLNNLAEDAHTGITAFLEKTAAHWKNR